MSAGRRNLSSSLRRRVVWLFQVQRECNAIPMERLLAKPDRARKALSSGAPCRATMARRAEARAAVVAEADLRLAEAAIPCRSGHAGIARDVALRLNQRPRKTLGFETVARPSGATGNGDR